MSSSTRDASRRPTIDTVAQRAGVSKSLVALVMRGAPNVSDARRQAVLDAAAELGYRPNLVARSLVERRTRTIGVLVNDLHNPFHAEVIDGLHEATHEGGLRMLLGTGRRDAAMEAEVVESFLQQDVDGLVLLSPDLSQRALAAAARQVPAVVVGRADLRAPRCDVVVNDDEAGGALPVDHLVGLGHRRIAHIAGTGAGAPPRRAGYEAAMRRHGLEPNVGQGDFTDEGGYEGVRALLDAAERPTAIFACNDLAALGALTAIEEAGLSVPADISLAGYDNTYLARVRHISLTSVDQPRIEMGRLAIQAVTERRERPDTPARVRLVPPHLVARSSTGAPPAG
jgi:DNA-binding LacI/PurR family transcriptional regulator